MTDDPTLLRRYAAERAEEAFAELVRRHLPLVYSAAVRRLGGDTHRAEDVAQVVFSTVARDARTLAQHSMLTGWLYTATRNAVIDVIRTEKRRRAREEQAHRMQEMTSDLETPADWSLLRPVIDAAMDELSADDREAVLLRFFAAQPFAEIGATLGLSEDAARKRVDRAVAKLGDLLRRRKIVSTAAALAALLASEAIATVPAGVATSVVAAALSAGGATAGVAAILTATKLKVAVAALIVGGGAAGFVLQQRPPSARAEPASVTPTQMAQLAAENAALVQARNAAEADNARLRAELGSLKQPSAAPTRRAETSPAVVASTQLPGALVLGPLPDTPEIRRQRANWHRRYEPFFRQRGLTAEQAERFVELKIHQAIAREDFQAAVRAANLRGDSRGVQALRAKDDSPVTRGLFELLGREGYEAYGNYEVSSAYRMSYVEPLLPAFASAGVSLSSAQAEQLLEVFARNGRHVQANRTDIGTTGSMDWDAVVAQAQAILTPAQLPVLQTYAGRQKTPK